MTTNSAAASGADNSANNLDDILGIAPKEEIEDKGDSEEKLESKDDEKAAKEEADSDKEPEKRVLVEHGAFHEEREKRRELQKQLADEKARTDRVEERQNKLFELLAKKEKPQEDELFTDPLARVENKVNEVVDKINKKAEAETAENKQLREDNELINKYSASAQAYSKDVPDFKDAYNYLLSNRQKELSLMGFSQAEINSQLRAEEKLIVSKAYDAERNPAEVVYSIAKERGYKVSAPDKTSKKTVEDIDKGLKASKSLGTAGAKSGDKEDLESLTASELAEMSQDEFDSFFNKIEKQANRKH